jgi:hypothetical protein
MSIEISRNKIAFMNCRFTGLSSDIASHGVLAALLATGREGESSDPDDDEGNGEPGGDNTPGPHGPSKPRPPKLS